MSNAQQACLLANAQSQSEEQASSPGAEDAPNAAALCPNAGVLDAPKGLAAVAPKPPNAGLAPKALVAPNAGALEAPNAGWLCPKAGAAPNAGAGEAPNAGWLCVGGRGSDNALPSSFKCHVAAQ